MNKYIFSFLFVFLFFSINAGAQKPIEIMLPARPFNDSIAANMLNGGTSQIKGMVFYEGRTMIGIKSEATVYAPPGTIVTLYPLTPYLEEYLKLKKKNREGKRIAAISPIAASYRIESKIVSQTGDFLIPGLRPGKYYLESIVSFPSGVGGREVSDIVEVRSDGETVECKLNHVYRGFIY